MRTFQAPPATVLGNVLTIATLLALFSSALIFPFVALIVVVASFLLPGFFVTAIAVVVAASFFVAKEEWPAAKNFFLFRHWRSFFALKVVMEEEEYPAKALFGCFPHGVFPLGLFLAASVSDELFPPERKTKGAVASVFFWIPLLGSLLTWLGCIPADAEKMAGELRANHSVFVLPEGPILLLFDYRALF